MQIGTAEIEIKWTDDCSGKKDFDAEVLSVDTRYWPRGGSHLEINVQHGVVVSKTDGSDPERQRMIPPSAYSSIHFGDLQLAEQHFQGETEEAVKAQVEEWVRARLESIFYAIIDKAQ